MDAKTHREARAALAHASRAKLEVQVTELLELRWSRKFGQGFKLGLLLSKDGPE